MPKTIDEYCGSKTVLEVTGGVAVLEFGAVGVLEE